MSALQPKTPDGPLQSAAKNVIAQFLIAKNASDKLNLGMSSHHCHLV